MSRLKTLMFIEDEINMSRETQGVFREFPHTRPLFIGQFKVGGVIGMSSPQGGSENETAADRASARLCFMTESVYFKKFWIKFAMRRS